MQEGFRFFPEQASTYAERVDGLYWFLVGMSAIIAGAVALLIVVFAVRYRRRPGHRAVQPEESMKLELVWTTVLTILVLVIFAWSSDVFLDQSIPPQGAQDIFVVGRQWMWKIQHPNGRREINELHIPAGRAMKLTLISQDVIHSFYIPAFRVKQDVLPGYYKTMWFEPTKPGTYHLFCAEYCGTNHSGMIGRVVVMEELEYQLWLAGSTEPSPQAEARQIFEQYDCAACHEAGGRERGPVLGGLYGQTVPLAGGESAVVDESYIRESILDPAAKVHAGYAPVMPSFRGQLTEEQILAVISYLKTLTPPGSDPQRGGLR